ncbi:hypothetical protein [Macrococcoides canis]|uniref:Uncharacterized protein n=1 Tax=Macrococcoides canis TaxID=1855823 RepID=A0A4V3BGB3_9STAP|nr:hypothetical protein [Macrococcus canis]MEE1107906.1 hypothetical protein [Macrococcus canis]TDM18595.1 hypothetical protein ETI04_03645 [Macrococcus canis]TDM21360.1 hypothetical protein ETI05_01065 [Macrococcus canis]TDM23812.1 hypothetical protein ETI02_05280 [Macrococcus canis]TDM31496.1 hypothetical protein ETI03_04035 [Macrococcus canis]
MGVILLKASYPDTSQEHTEYRIIQNEYEKIRYIDRAKNELYKRTHRSNDAQVIKLEFIYPDDIETYYYKA